MQKLIRKTLKLISKLTVATACLLLILLFWPAALTKTALCSEKTGKLDTEEEVAATIVVFLSSFLWLITVVCAINTVRL
jgi:hypothetical protein